LKSSLKKKNTGWSVKFTTMFPFSTCIFGYLHLQDQFSSRLCFSFKIALLAGAKCLSVVLYSCQLRVFFSKSNSGLCKEKKCANQYSTSLRKIINRNIFWFISHA
jgi:hypothetical protein